MNSQALRTSGMPLPKYVLRAAAIALIGSSVLGGTAIAIAHLLDLATPSRLPPDRQETFTEFLGLVVFGPVVETALLAITIRVLGVFTKSERLVSALAAFLWGALHGFIALLWFFGTVWSFYVYATGYQAFSKRSSSQAFLAACLPHSLVNLVLFAGVFLTGGRAT